MQHHRANCSNRGSRPNSSTPQPGGHGIWSIWLPIFTLSLCLGYMYERTGNLWVTVLMHAMFNGFSIVINLGSH